MLLGIWKNIAELEESISLPELYAILSASHRQEHRNHRFLAMVLKGIDIDEKSKEDAEEAVARVKAKAAARLRGESVEKVELEGFGIDIEEE